MLVAVQLDTNDRSAGFPDGQHKTRNIPVAETCQLPNDFHATCFCCAASLKKSIPQNQVDVYL
jgi:hypothetical protein